MMEARLASETDLAGFREEARALLAHQVPPDEVNWRAAHAQNSEFFADPAALDRRVTSKAASAIVPASFLRLCEVVVLHHDADRFALLYRLLWRLVHEPTLRNDPVDADMLHAQQLGQAVRRDIHKMKSFVKFQTVHTPDGHALQMAWYEPTHHILEAIAPWFIKRMPQQRWVIFTPERSVECDGRQLHFAPGLERGSGLTPEAPEAAWLESHQKIFGERAIAVSPMQ